MIPIESRIEVSQYTSFTIDEMKIYFNPNAASYAVAKCIFYLADGTTNAGSFKSIELTADDLSTWGEDDSIVKQIIANKTGIVLLEQTPQ